MPNLTEIVKGNPTIEEEDLKQLFIKRLEAKSQAWTLEMGFMLGIFSPVVILTISLVTQPENQTIMFSLLILFIWSAFALALRSMIQKDRPSVRHAKVLQDYLEARRLIREKPKTNGQTHTP